MRETSQDRIACDLASARTIDPHSGHMHVRQTNLSKATVNGYRGAEIPGWEGLGLDPDRVYNLLRDPEELKAAAESFNGKPLVLAHREQAIDDRDHANRVGSIGGVTYDHPFLKGDLAIWDQTAIDAVESGSQRELSCGYAYKPDMTPGQYEGSKFDGVMRSIGGNHVALVREGRAGKDCHVFDSIEGREMPKPVAISRTAIAAPIALNALLKPKMAKDAKPIDFGKTFDGVNKGNFKDKRQALAADVARLTKGKLAKDASPEEVMEVLQTLEAVIPEMEVEMMDSVENAGGAAPDADAATDEDDSGLRAFLKSLGLSDDDVAKACAMASGGASPAEDNEYAGEGGYSNSDVDEMTGASGGGKAAVVSTGPGVTTPDDSSSAATVGLAGGNGSKTPGQDKRMGKDKDMVTKTAMDAAIERTRRDAINEGARRGVALANEIRTAEREVAPYVGELTGAFDSAEGVYREALKVRGVAGADTLHRDALRPVLLAQPKAGDRRAEPSAFMAHDAAALASRDEMFPHHNRLKN